MHSTLARIAQLKVEIQRICKEQEQYRLQSHHTSLDTARQHNRELRMDQIAEELSALVREKD